jgi:cellulose synthase/poly-beta-1,6-N-acetylglucosamine synthase-like glycosyltransferase
MQFTPSRFALGVNGKLFKVHKAVDKFQPQRYSYLFSCPIFAFLPCMQSLLPYLLIFYYTSLAIHGAYVVFFYLRFLRVKTAFSEDRVSELPALSVLIAARNESENLYELLPKVMEQDYPCFEVVVVNNQSTDESIWLLKAYERQFPNLKIVQLEKSRHLRPGKKLPLTLAIKAAKYDHFVFTDADCIPASRSWLRAMAQGFAQGKEIVMGYGPHRKKPGFLNRLIRFDTAVIAMNYASFALAKVPYMGVGRNLAYSRKVFDSVGGFKSHYHLVSGDDDLLIQEAAKKRNYTVQFAHDAFCYSEAHTEWFRWRLQKTRHYSTSGRYDVIKKALLGIYPVTLWWVAISFILLCWIQEVGYLELGMLSGVVLVKWGIMGKGLRKMKEPGLAWFFPGWDMLYALLIPVLYVSVKRKVTSKW